MQRLIDQETITLTEAVEGQGIPLVVLLQAISSGRLKAEAVNDEILIKKIDLKIFIQKNSW